MAGVDEAGRGPWAGPVVAAAVLLRTSRLPVHVDDSKRLTARQRERAYAVICERAEVGVGIVASDTIDRVNILQATLLAMRHALEELPAPPDLTLVDGHLPLTAIGPCWPIVRGDQRSRVIACASIVAKVCRDRLMTFYHELFPAYAFNQHKGYGTLLHAARLARHGPCPLHRMTFRPVAAPAAVSPDTLEAPDVCMALAV